MVDTICECNASMCDIISQTLVGIFADPPFPVRLIAEIVFNDAALLEQPPLDAWRLRLPAISCLHSYGKAEQRHLQILLGSCFCARTRRHEASVQWPVLRSIRMLDSMFGQAVRMVPCAYSSTSSWFRSWFRFRSSSTTTTTAWRAGSASAAATEQHNAAADRRR